MQALSAKNAQCGHSTTLAAPTPTTSVGYPSANRALHNNKKRRGRILAVFSKKTSYQESLIPGQFGLHH